MNTVLLLKLCLVPALIALVTFAGRRWGPAVAGWLSAFPIVAGPILWFIALEHGADFAAVAAVGTLTGVLAILVYGMSYSWAATKYRWPASLALAYVAYALAAAAVGAAPLTLPVATLAVLVTLFFAPRAYPRREAVRRSGKPPNDLLLRMALGAVLVLTVTHFAEKLGPSLSGVLAMFPVMNTVLALFTHRSAGSGAVIQLLRGMVYGLYAFATFCVVLAWALPRTGSDAAFLWALAAAGIVQVLSKLLLNRHAAAAR
jgi:uncharacterized membrane protein (GlpM family)